MPDFSVPSWLQPPNEMERQRINEATTAAQVQAGVMLKRQIGMQRYQKERADGIANGLDPMTASQNALLNNAHLIWSDKPDAVSNLINREQANQIRQNALDQRSLEMDRRNELLQQAQERLSKKDEAINLLQNQKLIDSRQAAEEKTKLNAEKLQLSMQVEQGKNDRAQAERELRTQLNESNAQVKTFQEQEKNKRAQERNQVQLRRMLATDKQLKDLNDELLSKQATEKELMGQKPKLFRRSQDEINSDLAAVRTSIKELRGSIQQRKAELQGTVADMTGTEPAAPADEEGTDESGVGEWQQIGKFKVRKK